MTQPLSPPPTPAAPPACAWLSDAQVDLRAAVGADALLELALEAIPAGPLAGPVGSDARPNPRMLLSLLTYCYASGWFSSADVERAAYTDTLARYLRAREDLRANDVRHFRRTHRSQLEDALLRVLTQIGLRTPAQPDARRAGEALDHATIFAAAVSNARRRLSLALQLDAADAE